MAQIRISPDILNVKARILQENVEILRESLNNIKVINNEIKQSWSGSEIDFFQEKLDNFDKISVYELIEICEHFSNYIKKVAQDYVQTEEMLVNVFFGER